MMLGTSGGAPTHTASVQRLALLGIGLIGGSLAKALKQNNAAITIAGYDNDAEVAQSAVRHGVIDTALTAPEAAVANAEIVVLAAPPSATAALFRAIANHLAHSAVITDVGSVKSDVIAAARMHLEKHLDRFVPGHPLTGKEKNGLSHADALLFANQTIILTPLAETSAVALERITAMWQYAGAATLIMDAKRHDQLLAATSHLPHMLAYILVNCLANAHPEEEIFQCAAGGFRDFTRIASSDPKMWRDICLANREPLLDILQQFNANLSTTIQALRKSDGQFLLDCFTHAKVTRDAYLKRHHS